MADFHMLDAFCPEKMKYRSRFFLYPFFHYGCHCSADSEKGVLSALVNQLATW
jgi:hypothetical protein